MVEKAVVYCGPSIYRVARQYTVFIEHDGRLPTYLEDFIAQYPITRKLIIPIDDFAAFDGRLRTHGTEEANWYEQLRNEAPSEILTINRIRQQKV